MTSLTKWTTLAGTALAATLATAPAQAEVFGYLGVGGHFVSAENPSSSTFDQSTSPYLEGAIGVSVAPGVTVIGEVSGRRDYFSAPFMNFSPMTTEVNIAGHAWYQLGAQTQLGAFGGWANAPHDSASENYSVLYGGAEIVHGLGENLIGFGQVGYGSSGPLGGKSSWGFNQGVFGRVGLAWNGLANTSLRVEYETAGSLRYEDANERGAFQSIMIGGETTLTSDGRWSMNYSARYGTYDALIDADSINETTFSVGFRYALGGKTAQQRLAAGMIGTPTLPIRASSWTPAMD